MHGRRWEATWRGDQVDKALELLEETQRKGMEPSSITYNAASGACEKGKQPETALERGRSARTAGAVISACEKGLQTDEAVGLLEEM